MDRDMCIRLIFTVLSLCLALSPAYAERLKVHPSEQAAMNSMLEKLGIDPSDITTGDNYNYHSYYAYSDIKEKYFYIDNNRKKGYLHIATDIEDFVSVLIVSDVDINLLEEVTQFKRLDVLRYRNSSLKRIDDLSSLSDLVVLDVTDNDRLEFIGGIASLPRLKSINASRGKKMKSIEAIKGFPLLEEFICESCIVPSISFLESAKSLKILKIGMLGKTLDPLKNATNMEEIFIRSETLTDVSSINRMSNIKSLSFTHTNIKSLEIGSNLKNLRVLRLWDSPLVEMPNLSKLKSLQKLTFAGTNIGNIDKIHDLPELTRLVLTRNNTKRIVSLKNLPKLEELCLADQPLEVFETGVLPSLKELDLSSTNLTKLTGFENFPNLTNLKLYDTKVKSVRGIEKAEHLEYVQTDHTLPDSAENDAVFQEMKENRMRRFRERFGKYLD